MTDANQPNTNPDSSDGGAKKMTIVNCEPTVDITVVEELFGHLKKAVEERHVVEIEGEQIERIDGAVLQLFAVFFQEARRKDIQVTWKSSSESLLKAAQLLGLTEVLELAAA
jgi:ABC-type transporter Mla MlaB component